MPKVCILFTDIKKSSTLWAKHPTLMPNALKKHANQISKLCKKYKALIIKSIGDAYMLMLPNLYSCLDFCVELCKIQVDDPIKLKTDYLKIRIGFSYGSPIKKTVMIQNKKLLDYFGHAVNSASRMESKVSDVGGFAFTVIGSNNTDPKIMEHLHNMKVKTSLIHFKKNCNTKISRSLRLLNSEQLIACENESTLHGVGSLFVYKCTL